MDPFGRCTAQTLAQGPLCKVDVCQCGTLHVTVGMITLRFKPGAFRALCATLLEAVERLPSPRADDRSLC